MDGIAESACWRRFPEGKDELLDQRVMERARGVVAEYVSGFVFAVDRR
jgi:hypothetical protein